MKPSWDDAPEWANWLAMDFDGRWGWYEEKPEAMNGVWDQNARWGWAGDTPERASWHQITSEILEPRP